ncbi:MULTISPECIES: quinone oxidoreductase family protein [unclassified Myroides]|uniref:quinone oxidoreductase family protein n=1 Tax=unclassified Myroides TaxID=2642485 RepID=UPI003D2F9587
MKGAILYELGQVPHYGTIDEPQIQGEGEHVLRVTAAAVKNLDKARTSGKHYASYTNLPAVVGNDGVGYLEDGTRVYGQGITGMIAEKAIISGNYTPIPKDLDDVIAAALPNAILGSAMPLIIRARLQEGQNVLFNGATGVTGQIGVQIAKHYGAKEIIVTGRNEAILEQLKHFGATQTIALTEDNEALQEQIKTIHQTTPIDVVIDYLWGKPFQAILNAFKRNDIHHLASTVKIVTAGDMAGKEIQLTSAILRSTDIQLMGSGFGSLTQEELIVFNKVILPEMFLLAAQGKLHIQTEVHPLESIEKVWNKPVDRGTRLVIKI